MISFPSQTYQPAMLPWCTLSVMLNTIVNGPICVVFALLRITFSRTFITLAPSLDVCLCGNLNMFITQTFVYVLLWFANPGHGEWRLKEMWTICLSIFLVIFFTSKSFENPLRHVVPWPIVTLWVFDLSASNLTLFQSHLLPSDWERFNKTVWLGKIQQDSEYLMNGKDATRHLIS